MNEKEIYVPPFALLTDTSGIDALSASDDKPIGGGGIVLPDDEF